MNNPNTKSSIFDMKGSTVAAIIWLLAILTSLTSVSFILVIAMILILLFEKNSDYIRNHASQLLALSLFAVVIDIVYFLLFGGSFILFFSFFKIITSLLAWLVRLAITLVKLGMCLLGMDAVLKSKDLHLPFVDSFAGSLERSITPETRQ